MREEVKASLRTRSCECCTQEQQHQCIPCSLFSHPASTLFMMFCYYCQGEIYMLYPASLVGPCFLCFQNGSPHPLFANQCYQEISKKNMVVAFCHLTIRSRLKWRKQDTPWFRVAREALKGICHQESSLSLGHLSIEVSP